MTANFLASQREMGSNNNTIIPIFHPANAAAMEALTIIREITAAFTDFPISFGFWLRIALIKGGKIM